MGVEGVDFSKTPLGDGLFTPSLFVSLFVLHRLSIRETVFQ